MPIVSSVYELDGPVQANGAQGIKETHTDSVAGVHIIYYLAPAGTNHQQVANARGIKIAERLAETEFEAVINGE